jgi:hypothetical protein
MRHALIAAATVAATALLATASAHAAEPVHYAGAPMQDGKLCWVSTSNDLGYGFWHACPAQPVVHIAHKKR